MKPLTAKEVERILAAHGYLYHHSSGSHRIWKNPLTRHAVPVPRHGSTPLCQGTLNSIFNSCGIPKPPR